MRRCPSVPGRRSRSRSSWRTWPRRWNLAPHERVLEIGTGSGYAAAVLSRIAGAVFTVERHRELAETAAERLKRLGYDNVHVRCGDGTLGWSEEAPFDAIVVAAGGPAIPRPLLEQLRIGGRLVIPVGEELDSQQLIRAIRRRDGRYEYEDLGAVRFVPLIGEAGWPMDEESERPIVPPRTAKAAQSLPELIRRAAEPFYLDRVDPQAAAVARARYGCLTPWEGDPAIYGRATLTGQYRSCEGEVVRMLQDLCQRRVAASVHDGEDLFDAQLNARLVADAEQYYRLMYYGSDESWNHRDTHMFETLRLLLKRYGDRGKAVVWEHNSHLGNAAATQFGKHGQLNVGQLCRQTFGNDIYAIGQGTDHGTVAAASVWEGAMEVKHVRPALPDSYERLMHLTEMDAFFLPLAKSRNQQLTSALAQRRLERAIGVIYRPDTERFSHYFDASLPNQFDEWIWFDETSAIQPLTTEQSGVCPGGFQISPKRAVRIHFRIRR